MLQSVVTVREQVPNYYSDERSPQPDGGSLLDLHDLRAILRRRAKVAIGAFAATILAVLLYALIVPAKYTATATILSDPRQERVVPSDAVLPGIGTDIAAVESQVELLSSTELIKRVMEKLGLFSDPEFTKSSFLTRMKDSLLAPEAKGEAAKENEAIERFRKNLDVARRGLTYVLEVSFTSLDPVLSARIANAVTDTYLDDQIKQKTSATAEAGQWLQSRIDGLRDNLKKSERAVADFKSEHGLVDIGGADKSGRRLDRAQIDQINQELINARAEVAAATAKVEQMKRLVDHAGDLEELAAVQRLAHHPGAAQAICPGGRRRSQLRGDPWPATSHVAARPLANGASQGRDTNGGETDSAAAINEQETARRKDVALTASLAELTKQLEENDRLVVQLQDLERQADADNVLYTQVLARTKEVAEQESMQKPDARIIAPASPPTKPVGPGKIVLMAMALAGGALMALLGAFVAEQLDTSYRTRSQLEDDLGIPCLALCPLFTRRWLGRSSKTERQFVECIHLLRHEMLAADSKRPLVIVLSSALPGEGKSTLARALADSAAKSHQRTLLIDADAKARSLSRRMAKRARVGLFDVLRGDASVDEALITHSKFATLLPAGRADGDALASLTPARLKSVWEPADTTFDMVIIDSPPILSSVEAALLQDCADISLLIVQWGRTSRDDVTAARDAIRRGRKTALGAVLTKVDPKALRSCSYV